MTPEVGFHSNIAGYILILISVLCIIIHYLISTTNDTQNNDLLIVAKNYEDFNISSGRESLYLSKSKN